MFSSVGPKSATRPLCIPRTKTIPAPALRHHHRHTGRVWQVAFTHNARLLVTHGQDE